MCRQKCTDPECLPVEWHTVYYVPLQAGFTTGCTLMIWRSTSVEALCCWEELAFSSLPCAVGTRTRMKPTRQTQNALMTMTKWQRLPEARLQDELLFAGWIPTLSQYKKLKHTFLLSILHWRILANEDSQTCFCGLVLGGSGSAYTIPTVPFRFVLFTVQMVLKYMEMVELSVPCFISRRQTMFSNKSQVLWDGCIVFGIDTQDFTLQHYNLYWLWFNNLKNVEQYLDGW